MVDAPEIIASVPRAEEITIATSRLMNGPCKPSSLRKEHAAYVNDYGAIIRFTYLKICKVSMTVLDCDHEFANRGEIDRINRIVMGEVDGSHFSTHTPNDTAHPRRPPVRH